MSRSGLTCSNMWPTLDHYWTRRRGLPRACDRGPSRAPSQDASSLGRYGPYQRLQPPLDPYLVEGCGLSIKRERIYCPGRDVHWFFGGRCGEAKWALKAAALHLGGKAIFTRHYAALAVPRS